MKTTRRNKSNGEFMTGLEALQSVQFVNVKGKKFAMLDADEWKLWSNGRKISSFSVPFEAIMLVTFR